MPPSRVRIPPSPLQGNNLKGQTFRSDPFWVPALGECSIPPSGGGCRPVGVEQYERRLPPQTPRHPETRLRPPEAGFLLRRPLGSPRGGARQRLGLRAPRRAQARREREIGRASCRERG